MKRTIDFILISLLVFLSCNKGNLNEVTLPKDVLIDEPIEELIRIAGVEHNNGLAYVYEKLNAIKNEGKLFDMNATEVLSFSNVKTREFILDSEVCFIVKNRSIALEFSDLFFQKVGVFNVGMKSNYDFNIWDLVEDHSINSKQREILEVLDAAINSEKELSEIIVIFEEVRKRVQSECDQDEIPVVLAAIEIGINSMTYWNENLDNWVTLLGNGEKSWFSWRQVAAFDVAGAIGGAAVTAFTGGAIAAGIIGGAVGSSVVSASVQVICHYGNCN